MITLLPTTNGKNGHHFQNGNGTSSPSPSKGRKRRSARGMGKKAYVAASVLALCALHFVIDEMAVKPTRQISLALVRNEFLDKPPTKIVVMGEINSGDKYAANVLRHAFARGMTVLHDHIHRRDLLSQNELNEIAGRTDVLWIMVVRSPCTWADSLIRFQKDSCDKGELPRDQCAIHEFASDADYYRVPWYDWLHDDSHDWHHVDEESDEKDHIVRSKDRQSLKYDDIFDMRKQKLLLMKQIMDAVPRHVKVLRLGEFELNPDVFVKDLVKEYQFKLSKDYTPPQPSVNPESMFFDPKSTFTCMDHAKWREAQQRVDWTLEGYFGHNRLECHLCRGAGDDSTETSYGTGHVAMKTPSNIYVLGERNSGTTYVSNTLAAAFDPPNEMGSKLEKFSSDVPVLLHKHMFRHDLLNREELDEIRSRDDILWILVVRSPCDWAEGMFRKPYHLCPPKHPEKCGPESDPNDKIWMNQNSVVGVSLLEFFTTMSWGDWAESVPFMRKVEAGEKKDGEEVSISKVSANYTYPNVFGLRRHKLNIMKQIIETVPRNVKFVHLKELERSPEIFIQSVVREFNMTLKEGYAPQPQSKVAHPTVCLTSDEWDAAQRNVDWELEAEFGFSPFDCRMCYGYDKSTKLYQRVMAGKKIKKIIEGKEEPADADEKEDKKGTEQNKSDRRTGKAAKNNENDKRPGKKRKFGLKKKKKQRARVR